MSQLPPQSRWLIALLAAFVALGPLSTDMYLPALPAIQETLAASTAQTQLTLSVYLAGFALFHLLCGPLADRYGRRPVLAGGLLVYIMASLACAQSDSIGELILWRFLQALGACCGPTLGRAIIRDTHDAVSAARAMSWLAAIMALAPAVAPIIGGWLTVQFHWSASFYGLSLYAAIALVLLLFFLPETLPVRQPFHPSSLFANYGKLIRHRSFFSYTLVLACNFAGLFCFVSGASFVLINLYGVAPDVFGYYFIFVVLGYLSGTLLSGFLNRRWSQHRLLATGLNASLAAPLLMGYTSQQFPHPLAIVVPMMLYLAGVGLVLPQSMAGALRHFPHLAGTASALLGFFQMTLASVAGVLVGLGLERQGTATPMLVIMGVFSLMAFLLYHRYVPHTDKMSGQHS